MDVRAVTLEAKNWVRETQRMTYKLDDLDLENIERHNTNNCQQMEMEDEVDERGLLKKVSTWFRGTEEPTDYQLI
jgi:hypothetical protein